VEKIKTSVSVGGVVGGAGTGASYAAVGALGTAKTGAAISGLYGAAKTSATVAWLGGPVGWGILAVGLTAGAAYSAYKLTKD